MGPAVGAIDKNRAAPYTRNFVRGLTNEADFSTQQPAAQAHSRLPGPHAEQGWASGAEAAPPERAPAARGLSAASGTRATLRPRDRLHAAADFQRVLRRGLRLEGALFLLVAAPNSLGRDRLGLVAGRRQGTAAARNRLRRLVREAFRTAERGEASGCDLVILPRPELLRSPFREIQHELRQRLRRLAARLAARSSPHPHD